jgi:hypothetical protein
MARMSRFLRARKENARRREGCGGGVLARVREGFRAETQYPRKKPSLWDQFLILRSQLCQTLGDVPFFLILFWELTNIMIWEMKNTKLLEMLLQLSVSLLR